MSVKCVNCVTEYTARTSLCSACGRPGSLSNPVKRHPPHESIVMKPFYSYIESVDKFVFKIVQSRGIDPVSFGKLKNDVHLLYKFKHHYCYKVYRIGWSIGYYHPSATTEEDLQLSSLANELRISVEESYKQTIVNAFLKQLEETLLMGIAFGDEHKYRL